MFDDILNSKESEKGSEVEVWVEEETVELEEEQDCKCGNGGNCGGNCHSHDDEEKDDDSCDGYDCGC